MLAVVLTGCVSTRDIQTPAMPDAAAATTAWAQELERETALETSSAPTQWWALFNDPLLISLEDQASDNFDVREATARIDEAHALLGITRSAQSLQLGASGSARQQGLSENGPLARLGAPTEATDFYEAGFQASWELDLWGHLRYQRQAASARLIATGFRHEAMQVSVSAEVARTYLLLRGIQAQLAIVQGNRDIATHLVQVAESRHRNGVASRLDTASANAELASLQARTLQLQQQRDGVTNALALLLAQPPRVLDTRLASAPLPTMPARLPVGLPSELAQRRPDIQEAAATLRASVADIGAARADFYPRIQLSGRLGVEAFDADNLGDWGSRTFAVGPVMHLPIFQGGRLKSNLALTQARHQLAAIRYQRTVLAAWHEVDAALRAYQTERMRQEALQDALQQSTIALSVARRAYGQGSVDITGVLVAQRALLGTQAALADCATASALSVVSLYRALGGGWSPALAAPAADGQAPAGAH
ncbi:efflux transporter, outer membrane factor (OMF) lipoprotein, NodT family [Pseudoxanthomonas sp. GM95]|uniref:efflux transporter outer membrane subunit n=1 Tax=Pseudoxanthomonas sp. GM95 TaxID=1881043 RepID=UPI0008BEBDAE|nr:efflux transporter outer membrane subunit [Pseudoxanthomonas sp. GM95]SEL11840.1 efflux transporter, outer membrane factor (OMF) lipoprotein, NodT family [Pseudoxanthomonas sp. GM95]